MPFLLTRLRTPTPMVTALVTIPIQMMMVMVVVDSQDQLPLDGSETTDFDSDGIGDNAGHR